MTKKTLVVGGGIVGITAAYFKALQGYQVTLVEGSNEIGGLLKSSQSDFGSFDYGVHIASRTGLTALDNFLFDHDNQYLHAFDTQQAGSFFNQQLTEFSPFLNLNSLPQQQGKIAGYELIKTPTMTDFDNLAVALKNLYGETAYNSAFLPYIKQTFGVEPSELPTYYLNFFDMYRVVAFDEKTTHALKKVDYINDRLGFQEATPGVEKFYPKEGGIAAWTQKLFQKMLVAGVDVLLNTTVSSINYQPNNITVVCSSSDKSNDKSSNTGNNANNEQTSEYHIDELVWTVSSALLPRYISLNSQLKKPNFRKTALFDFVYTDPISTSCKYINNFSSTHVSTRLTCYQNLLPDSQFYAITVEVLVDKIVDETQLLAQVSTELKEMKLIKPNNSCVFSQYRPVNEGFPIITKENDLLLKQLNSEILTTYPNIQLLGRSSSKGFFMSELLIDAYQCCQ